MPVEQRSYIRIVQIAVAITALLIALVIGLLAAEQPLIAILGVVALAGVLASLFWPETTTLVFFLILLTNTATIAVKFHGLPFIIGATFPLLLVIPVGNYLILKRQKIIVTPPFLLLLGLLLVQFIGTLGARDIDGAASELMVFAIEAILIYFLVLNAIRTREILRWVVFVFLISSIILGLVPIYQQITGDFKNNFGGYGQAPGDGFSTNETLLGGDTQLRLAGAIGEKNRFAQFMLMFGMIAVSQIGGGRTRTERAIAMFAAAVSFTAATLPFSRGAAVGFVLTLVLAVPLSIISLRQLLTIALAAGVILVMFPQYSERLLSISSVFNYASGNVTSSGQVDGATKGRTTEMLAALMVYADHPIVGVGPGQYRYYSQDVGNDLGIKRLDENRQAHNLLLDIAANTGTLGLLFTTGIVAITLRDLHRIHKHWRKKHPDIASMATGFLLAIVTYLTTGVFLHHAYLRYFWAFMAVAGAIILIARQEAANDDLLPKLSEHVKPEADHRQ